MKSFIVGVSFTQCDINIPRYRRQSPCEGLQRCPSVPAYFTGASITSVQASDVLVLSQHILARPHITSFIKTEVHNVSQHCSGRMEQGIDNMQKKIWQRSYVHFQRYGHGERDTHTDTIITILHLPSNYAIADVWLNYTLRILPMLRTTFPHFHSTFYLPRYAIPQFTDSVYSTTIVKYW